MAVAAAAGQAVAGEHASEPLPAATATLSTPEPSPTPDRPAASPALVVTAPTEAAPPRAPPPEAIPAAIPGLSPAPPGPVAEAPAAPRPAAPPPPVARQLAQVTIALALGTGQAPRLTVALEPEELGRVEIRIERGADGEAASVRILAERPETLALLQRDVRELDRALGQAGLQMAAGALQFGLSSGEPGQQGRQQGSDPGAGPGGWGGRGPSPPAEATRPASLALSLLDIAV